MDFVSNDITFRDWDVLKYYFYLFQDGFSEYSWQVRTCYFIVVGCIATMILLFMQFAFDVLKRHREKKNQKKFTDKMLEKFQAVLYNDTMTAEEIEQTLEISEAELRKVNPQYIVSLLSQIRMELYEIVYLPNMEALVDFCGVRDFFEHNLLVNKNVFQTLQVMMMMQIRVSEGRLANYVNSNNSEIRMMARLCYILSSTHDPYRYLLVDSDQRPSEMQLMMLHYIFGWMKNRDRNMPDFIVSAERIQNERKAAFMIDEVSYWGSQEEKQRVSDQFLSPKYECRIAAINVVATLKNEQMEQALIETYERQPEHIRRTILEALLTIKSGEQVDFFKKAFETSASEETQELALRCLYNYNTKGRYEFEVIRHASSGNLRHMMDHIDSVSVLATLRSYV